MSELADLMAVFGAVDRAVAGDERRLLPAVASLVPEYNHRAAGWFDGVRSGPNRGVGHWPPKGRSMTSSLRT